MRNPQNATACALQPAAAEAEGDLVFAPPNGYFPGCAAAPETVLVLVAVEVGFVVEKMVNEKPVAISATPSATGATKNCR